MGKLVQSIIISYQADFTLCKSAENTYAVFCIYCLFAIRSTVHGHGIRTLKLLI